MATRREHTPPPPPPSDRRLFPLSRSARRAIIAAFAAGLVLFLLMWLDARNNQQFYRAPVATDEPSYQPLPVPGGESGAAPPAAAEPAALPPPPPRPVESARAPLPLPAPPAHDTPPTAPPPANTTARGGETRAAIALSTPDPRYPPEALRAGLGGEVRLRLHIDADGQVESIDIVSGSGTRELDRAAVQAARRWQFRPALDNGRPVAGTLLVPVRFTPQE